MERKDENTIETYRGNQLLIRDWPPQIEPHQTSRERLAISRLCGSLLVM